MVEIIKSIFDGADERETIIAGDITKGKSGNISRRRIVDWDDRSRSHVGREMVELMSWKMFQELGRIWYDDKM